MVKDSFILDYDTNGLKTFVCEFVGSTNLAAGRKIGTPGSQTPMATFVTDPYWGENLGESEELPGGGWQLLTGITQKWVAIHLEKRYYVQRVVYMLAKGYVSDLKFHDCISEFVYRIEIN